MFIKDCMYYKQFFTVHTRKKMFERLLRYVIQHKEIPEVVCRIQTLVINAHWRPLMNYILKRITCTHNCANLTFKRLNVIQGRDKIFFFFFCLEVKRCCKHIWIKKYKLHFIHYALILNHISVIVPNVTLTFCH